MTFLIELEQTTLKFCWNDSGTSGKETTCQCRRHENWVRSLHGEDPLETGMATHSNILDWGILWQRSLIGYSTQGHKDSDMTEATQRAQKTQICQSDLEKKRTKQKNHTRLHTILQSYSNQNQMVLAQKQTHRSGKQNKGSETNVCLYAQLISKKKGRQEKRYNWYWENLVVTTCRITKSEHFLIPHKKNNMD